MDYTSLKEFAEQHNISYEAARKSFTRYAKDLEGHTVMKDRTRMLDEYAVKYLEEKRRSSPIITIVEGSREDVKRLEEEVAALREQLLSAREDYIQLQNKHVRAQNRIIDLQETAREALIMREKYEQQQKEVDTIRREAAERKAEDAAIIAQLTREKEAAKQEADTIRKDADEAAAVVAQMTQELTTARQEADQAKAEAGRYERSWFGFYRKR